MTGRDEQHLSQRVNRALAAVTVGPARGGGIVARGRAIRWRRRLAEAGAVAVAAAVTAVAVALPGLLFTARHQDPGPGR